MAKVKINKLPKGFELVDGKVKKKTIKRDGGLVTGDQANYGLVTTPEEFYGDTNFNDDKDVSVRYSLSSVPREDANIEAEGGETVLTDLNNNGQFGLYDITGPRHSQGGVPMYLPEQSFIFSDTNAMKMDRSELAEFGIESRKKKTPAEVSKKFKLNEYLAQINDQYADEISTRSADMMLSKNMRSLSKLAFGQELKKGFEDGVPLAAYPYLQEQGIDPIDFTAQIEEQSRQQAELNFIASLPPEQQDQILRLQAMMQNIENPDAGVVQDSSRELALPDSQGAPNEADLAIANEDLTATLKRGGELAKAQAGTEVNTAGSDKPQDGETYNDYVKRIGSEEKLEEGTEGSHVYNSELGVFLPVEKQKQSRQEQPEPTAVQDSEGKITREEAEKINPLPKGHAKRKLFTEKIMAGYNLVEERDEVNGKTKYRLIEPAGPSPFENFTEYKQQSIDVQGQGSIPITDEITNQTIEIYEGFPDNARIRKGIYSGQNRPKVQSSMGENSNSFGADLSSEIAEKDFMIRWGEAAAKVPGFNYKLPQGKWSGSNPVDAKAKAYKKQWTAMQNAMQEVENEFAQKNNLEPRILFPGDRPGSGIDGKLGLDTFNKARSYIRTKEQEIIEEEVADTLKPRDPNALETPKQEKPEWWWQDLNNLATQASLENPLFLPNIPKVPNEEIDYVLDDWTGRANMTNAALNTMAQNLRAFGKGKVAGSNLFGKAVSQLAKDVGSVNTNNIRIMNSVALPQAQLNLRTGVANAQAYKDEYDSTVTALQRYIDFENWDKQKTNELYNQAITNRANTFNMNQLKDYYKADPSAGGIQSQKYAKPLEVDKDDRTDAQKRMDMYFDKRDALIEKYPNMPESEIEDRVDYLLTGQTGSRRKRSQNYNDFEDGSNPNASGLPSNAPSVRTDGLTGRRGKEIKPFAYPFYTGKMGM